MSFAHATIAHLNKYWCVLACVRSAITCHSLTGLERFTLTVHIVHQTKLLRNDFGTLLDFCFDQQGGGLPKTFKKLKVFGIFFVDYIQLLMLIYVLQPPYYAPPFLLGVEGGLSLLPNF